VSSYSIEATRDGVLRLRVNGKTIERPMKAGEILAIVAQPG
jgi:hypothetical protein